ncbi:arginyl-tRNA synthetase [Bacillus pakistanensis]|uniref:Arginine--tRNA ligase n=1 Tax=Rossellomorea pakistanensis TaxID=992288 RepID=A0ABS2NJN6_9BACI|nr:arginine--tRNA ligase [Bacillus pakistanensis]MBM7588050.1 arginyl-tRNA synthetase [Bacillus pakistanensis]
MTIDTLKTFYSEALHQKLKEFLTIDEVYQLIETPKYSNHGDFAFPCFQLAKLKRQSPQQIAEELASELNDTAFSKVEAVGPYVNVFLNGKLLGPSIVDKVLTLKNDFGSHSFGKDKTIAIDMSSPNIAKPFSMGHLRSTVIGNSLALLANKCGYNTVRINYIGDWGTQFGKLIVAYKKWGEESKVRQNPIGELFKLYTKFHEESENDPNLEGEGRKAFKLLEDGDPEITRLWKWFREESLMAFKKIYKLLGVEFDSYNGEAYYNDKMEEVVEQLKHAHLLETSKGAEVVRLDELNLPPCLIKKSDGATLYATRDLASALDRQNRYKFDQALYVVGQEQGIHFKQVFSVLGKLGYQWSDEMKHIPFGLYLKAGKKMSTRKGRVILLEDVLNEAIKIAQDNIKLKNPDLSFASEVAKAVGAGAVIFHDLKNDRQNDIEFSLEDMLTFEGETGPYIQYTHARAQSLLRKASDVQIKDFHGLDDHESWEIIKLLHQFPQITEKAHNDSSPSVLAKYLLQTAKAFNKYYGKTKILVEDEEKMSRLALVESVTLVLEEGLFLLGISAPKEM